MFNPGALATSDQAPPAWPKQHPEYLRANLCHLLCQLTQLILPTAPNLPWLQTNTQQHPTLTPSLAHFTTWPFTWCWALSAAQPSPLPLLSWLHQQPYQLPSWRGLLQCQWVWQLQLQPALAQPGKQGQLAEQQGVRLSLSPQTLTCQRPPTASWERMHWGAHASQSTHSSAHVPTCTCLERCYHSLAEHPCMRPSTPISSPLASQASLTCVTAPTAPRMPPPLPSLPFSFCPWPFPSCCLWPEGACFSCCGCCFSGCAPCFSSPPLLPASGPPFFPAGLCSVGVAGPFTCWCWCCSAGVAPSWAWPLSWAWGCSTSARPPTAAAPEAGPLPAHGS